MKDFTPEIYQRISGLLDFNSLVRSAPLCQRWADFVTSIYWQRLEQMTNKMKPVETMTMLDFNQEDCYQVKFNDEATTSIVHDRDGQKQFLPKKLVLQNDVKEKQDEEKIFRRCVNLTPLWWTKNIESVHLRDFPLRLCPALLKRFPNKLHFDIFSSDKEQVIDRINKPTVEHVRKILAVNMGCNISIKEQRCRYNVLLDDSILELIISKCIQRVPLGCIFLNMRSSVSVSVLIRFIEAVSDVPLSYLLLKARNEKRDINIKGLEVYGDCGELLRLCNKHKNWNIHFRDQMQFTAEFKIEHTSFNLTGRFHEKPREVVELDIDDM